MSGIIMQKLTRVQPRFRLQYPAPPPPPQETANYEEPEALSKRVWSLVGIYRKEVFFPGAEPVIDGTDKELLDTYGHSYARCPQPHPYTITPEAGESKDQGVLRSGRAAPVQVQG